MSIHSNLTVTSGLFSKLCYTANMDKQSLAKLKLWPDNYNEGDVGMIAASIRRFGFNDPPGVWKDNEVRDGNHRVMALRIVKAAGPRPDEDKKWPPQGVTVKGADWFIDRVDLSHLNEQEATAYAIAANRSVELASQDDLRLSMLLQNIAVEDEKLLAAAGYSGDDLDELLRFMDKPPEDAGAQIDRAAELQEIWGVKTGDLWIIPSASGDGVHKLLCGDSTVRVDVERLCVEPVQGVFTSPPYAEQRKQQYGGIPTDEYVDWWEDVQANVRAVLQDDGSFFVNIKPHVEDTERVMYVFELVIAMKRRWDWTFIDEYCWLRSGVPKRVMYRFKNGFEPIYQFTTQSRDFKFNPQSVMHGSDDVPQPGGPGVGDTNWANKQGKTGPTASGLQGSSSFLFGGQDILPGKAYPSNVLRAYSNDEALGHSAAFPVQLPEFFIKAYSDPGDTWFDPFMGSGTVFVAAEQNGRIAYGMEQKVEYCAVILERMSGLGLKPERVEQ